MNSRRWGFLLVNLLLLSACAAPVVEPRTPLPTDDPPASPLATVSPTPTDVAASPPATEPAPTADTGSSPTPTATAGGTPSAGQTLPSAGPDGWIGPLAVGTRAYEELSLVIDRHGVAHAAAELDDSIFYLTNASGSWTRERISSPASGGSDREPSIAYDPDEEYLAVAFTRYSRYRCEELGCYPADSIGVHVTANYAGSWSTPQAVSGNNTMRPRLSTGPGQLHLAYERVARQRSFVHHATDAAAGPAWVDTQVAEGGGPSLQVGRDGRPRIAYSSEEGIRYAVGGSVDGAPFDVQPVPGAVGWPELLLDTSDQPQIVYTSWEDPWSIRHQAFGGGGWAASTTVATDELHGDAALDERGGVHIIFDVVDYDDEDGLWYIGNRAGSWERRQVDRSTRAAIDGPVAGSALAVDSAGRPHILFMVPFDDDRLGLYYAIGPGY